MTARRARACPDAESFARLIDGALEVSQRARLLDHLDQCPLCLDVVLESQKFVDMQKSRGHPRNAVSMGGRASFPKSVLLS